MWVEYKNIDISYIILKIMKWYLLKKKLKIKFYHIYLRVLKSLKQRKLINIQNQYQIFKDLPKNLIISMI